MNECSSAVKASPGAIERRFCLLSPGTFRRRIRHGIHTLLSSLYSLSPLNHLTSAFLITGFLYHSQINKHLWNSWSYLSAVWVLYFTRVLRFSVLSCVLRVSVYVSLWSALTTLCGHSWISHLSSLWTVSSVRQGSGFLLYPQCLTLCLTHCGCVLMFIG